MFRIAPMNQKLLKEIRAIDPDARYCVVIHYAEVGLKGRNRYLFEDQLVKNVSRALKGVVKSRTEKSYGRLLTFLPESFDWEPIRQRLQKVFGIAHFAPGVLIRQQMETITAVATQMMQQQSFASFRVTTKRANKEFPYNSQQVNTLVGAAIQQATGARVDLSHPQKTCFIEIFNQHALIYVEKIPGTGGLPSGVSEKAVSLLSSGFDSPVAAWKIMKRGVRVIFVHFHSVPFTSNASIRNVRKIVRLLTEYQLTSRLYLVPFLEIQQQIMVNSPPEYRVVLYRRSMVRLAERIARKERASALITGESIGQVASQTLTNMRVVNEAASLPVLRPLSGDDKQEIIDLGKRLGTYDISREPYEDCCTLFVPRHPVIKADAQKVREIEEKLNLDELYQNALKRAEIQDYRFPDQKNQD